VTVTGDTVLSLSQGTSDTPIIVVPHCSDKIVYPSI
jgi:hypothetical protein